ncbi:MAG: glycosyltransferase [Bacteroides intestinalis]|nr:glycosyltransferase [Bacteroides intestinalis]
MNNIKISILISAYNVENYIEECLHSLKCQTLKEIEVIIVDDGSTDKTGEIAEMYAHSDRRFRVVHQSNKGLTQSRNIGLSLAQGKYVGFVDGDDYVSKDAFEQLFLRAEAYSADIVLGSVLYTYEDGTFQRVGNKSVAFQSHSGTMEGKQCFKLLIKTGCYIPMVWSNLYRLDFIQQNQLHFEATFHEDEYFMPYALFFAKKVIDINIDFYFYRQRQGSIMRNDNNLIKRSESLFFISSRLKEFIKEKTNGKECDEAGQMFLLQAGSLYERAQSLYERQLSISSKKCLFIISEESVAGKYGVGTYINQLTQCFDLSIWNVNVIILHARSKEVQWKIKEGIAYYEIPMPGKMQYYSSSLDEKQYYRGVFYYLASRLTLSPKIYCHFNFAIHHDLALLFKKKSQAKIVFTLHYTDWSFDLLGGRAWLKQILANPIGNKDNQVKKTFEREKAFMMECCDYVVTIANHSYRMLKELYEIPQDKLAFVPNALKDEYQPRNKEELNTLRKKYGFNDNDKIVLFAGRIDSVKGFAELIEAIKLVQREIPNTKLVIAGSGNYTLALSAIAPCWSGFVFTGFLSKEQLYDLYAIADIGVVPSKHEEFGYVAVEMMMHRLPVIVNNTTGLKEIVENGKFGVIFDYGENWGIKSLKEKIISNLTSDKSNNQMIKEARNKILECYSLDSFCRRIQNIYNHMENPCGTYLNNLNYLQYEET